MKRNCLLRDSVLTLLLLQSFTVLPTLAEDSTATAGTTKTTAGTAADDIPTPRPVDDIPTPRPDQGKSVFEFDSYEQIVNPLLSGENERLCGLDKACIELWRKGKLQIFTEGRLFTGDFNNDGKPDSAVILEKDIDEDDPSEKAFYIYITTAGEDGKRKVLLHELLPDTHSIVEFFWDAKRNALVIDTGGRVQRSENVTQLGGAAFIYESAEKLYKVIIAISWNPKTQKFDIVSPVFGKKKRK